MASLDSRIPLAFQAPQINSPAQNKLAALAVRGAEMDLDQRGQALQQRNALMELSQRPDFYNSAGGINPAMMPEIGRVAPDQALGYSKAIQGQQKALSDAQMAQLNQAKTQLELVGRLVGGVTDEQSFQAARQQAQAYGIPLDGVPAQYDPNWVQQTRQQTLTAQQQIDNFYKERGLDLQQQRLQHDIKKSNVETSGAKPPTGYRYSDDGSSLVAIPGGPADIKAGELGKKTAERQKAAISQANRVMSKVDEAIDKIGFWSTGMGADTMASVGGTDARALRSALDTIKANLGFAELQAMREASPTGGALGSVAVQELMALQSTIASLDQGLDDKVLRQNLLQIKQHYQNWLDAVQQSNAEEVGTQSPVTQQPAQASNDGIPLISNPQQLQGLPSGTVVRVPDGSLRTVP
nr:hypothetical protein [Alcaligenes faecalis]